MILRTWKSEIQTAESDNEDNDNEHEDNLHAETKSSLSLHEDRVKKINKKTFMKSFPDTRKRMVVRMEDVERRLRRI